MLQIRPQQWAAFQSVQEERFVERMIEFLKSNFDDERSIRKPVHRERILKLTRTAKSYGLTTEQQVASYIVLAKARGETFDQEPVHRKVLTDPDLEGDRKIERLIHEGGVDPTP